MHGPARLEGAGLDPVEVHAGGEFGGVEGTTAVARGAEARGLAPGTAGVQANTGIKSPISNADGYRRITSTP